MHFSRRIVLYFLIAVVVLFWLGGSTHNSETIFITVLVAVLGALFAWPTKEDSDGPRR
jgi:UPF0716 family protein affecting phage T7 exclusion